MNRTAIIFFAAAIWAAPANAQSPFSYEIGANANFTKFEAITKLDNGLGIGLNLGTYLLPRLSIDLSGDWASNKSARSGNSLSVINNRADLIYNLPLNNQWRLMLGAGWTGTDFSGDKTTNEYDSGPNALLGLRYCVGDDWSWTGQVIGDYKDPADQTPAFNKTTTWVARIGLARAFGKNRAKGPCVNAMSAPLPPPPPPARTAPAAAPPQPAAAPAPPPEPAPQPAPARPVPTPTPAAAAQAPEPKPLMSFSPVYFAFNETALTKAAKDTLDGVVRYMNTNANAKVEATGYTDDRGNDDYNARLGARRATVVKDYLVLKGITASRIMTGTKGEADPAESNATEAGRTKNRRAVVVEVR
ncbi:MAG: OmpA family protein [Gemmatimonadetes bacterium]|nr:OmpA family protein [Gemmatimonadota bacterium]